MMTEVLMFAMDAVVIILLAVALFFGVKLHRGLRAFQQSKNDFQSLVLQLIKATDQADQTIKGFRHNAEEIGSVLQKEMNEARTLFDELQFMNEAGNNLASRLEKLSSKAVQENAPFLEKTGEANRKSSVKKPPSKVEQELLAMVKAKKQK